MRCLHQNGMAESSDPPPVNTAAHLVLKELKDSLGHQPSSFQSLNAQAGTVLSVLIGATSAALTLLSIGPSRPAAEILIPTLVLLGAVVVSVLAFLPTAVGAGPAAEGLVDRVDEELSEFRTELVANYAGLVEDNRRRLSSRRNLVTAAILMLLLAVGSTLVFDIILYVNPL